MKVSDVHEIYRKIAAGTKGHGGFLCTFAKALLLADYDNELLMQPTACALIEKYSLQSYAEVLNRQEPTAEAKRK